MQISKPAIERPHFERPHFERPHIERPQVRLPWRQRPEERVRRASVVPLIAALAAAAGAALAYLFDPDRGKARRAMVRDMLAARLRDAGEIAARTGTYAGSTLAGKARGIAHRLSHGDTQAPNDAELAHKVETELFRDQSVPKGRININAEYGTVVLRGVADSPEQIEQIASKAASIEGVHEVRNLLHLEGTPAPHEAPRIH